MTQLLEITKGLEVILSKGNYKQKSTTIPNGHKAMMAYLPTLSAVAEKLGVDFAKTRYTFNVSKKSERDKNIYGLVISNIEGVPTLVWGHHGTPLAELKIEPILADYDGKMFIDFDLDDETTLTVPMSLEGKPNSADIRKALKKGPGELAPFLKEGFIRPIGLGEVDPGTYTATAYKVEQGQSGPQYTLKLDGLGWVKCNSKMSRRLAAEPTITEAEPATLTIEPSTETTNQGNPIIPVTLELASDALVEVFDFD